MFPESKIEHIEDLLGRALEIERPNKWKFLSGLFLKIGVFIFGIGFNGLKIQNCILEWTFKNLNFSGTYIFVIFIGFLIIIMSTVYEYSRKDEFKSFVEGSLKVIRDHKRASNC